MRKGKWGRAEGELNQAEEKEQAQALRALEGKKKRHTGRNILLTLAASPFISFSASPPGSGWIWKS